ncbi:MAG: hypothetical protein IJW58_01735 [Clostridia bacterium]|nr:hypothetical protein [Clostridia bacterium]
MNKINGYTEEEAKRLVEYIKRGKEEGKTLTWLFASYGEMHGRARGSVRNYYYSLMKNEKGDERIVKLLDGSKLRVEKIREFTEDETNETLKSILREKSKGLSVRRAICNLAKGDDKLMLRLQNKYRNVLKKQPERLKALAGELDIPVEEREKLLARGRRVQSEKRPTERDFLQRRLENEINHLYDKLTKALKEENERLRAENEILKGKKEC